MSVGDITVPSADRPPPEAFADLALIDECIANEWREDLTQEDVAAMHASFEDEVRSCVASITGANDRRDHASVGKAAHRLKGMAGTFGALQLAAVARHLEQAATAGGGRDVTPGILQLDRTTRQTLAALNPTSNL